MDDEQQVAEKTLLLPPNELVEYIKSVCETLLGASSSDLDASLGEKYNIARDVKRTAGTFAADSNPLVMFVTKEELEEGMYFKSKFCFFVTNWCRVSISN